MNEIKFNLEPVDKKPDLLDVIQKPKLPPLIGVDSKEASRGDKAGGKNIYENLKKFEEKGMIVVEVDYLGDAIDYEIPTIYDTYQVIQRKTANEMVNIKKVYEDIIEMKSRENAEPYLLIEGTLSQIQKWSKINIHSIIGGVEKIILPREYGGYGCPIIPSPNKFYTANWLLRRAINVGIFKEKKDFHMIRTVPKELTPQEQGLFFLTGLTGISEIFGIRLLEEYETPYNALINIDKWSDTIERWGEKRHQSVLDQIHAKWSEREK